jgi:hypothetical protein
MLRIPKRWSSVDTRTLAKIQDKSLQRSPLRTHVLHPVPAHYFPLTLPSPVISPSSPLSSTGAVVGHWEGPYVCRFRGCTAAAFQTQYLLNSHANVHSSARPHFCPVEGCPRVKGGKGFKRKNEVIRHGLLHDSPGYACPWCPSEEDKKYPRPDNLMRYISLSIGDTF